MAATPTIAYAIFLHLNELKRRRTHYIRLSETKIQLTAELIAQQQRKWVCQCSNEDLEALMREKQFKSELERELHHRQKQLNAIAKKLHKVKSLQKTKKRKRHQIEEENMEQYFQMILN